MQSYKDKSLRDWGNIDFWNYSIDKYRASKMIRNIISKNGKGFKFRDLAKDLGMSRDYIYQVMMMNIKPSEEFLRNLKEIDERR